MQGKITSIEIGSNEHGEYKKAKVETADGTKTVYVSPKVKNIYNGVEPGKVVTLKAKNNGNGFLIAGFGVIAQAPQPQVTGAAWDSMSGKEFAEKAEKGLKAYAYLLKKATEHGFEGSDAVDAAKAVLNLLK